MLVRRNFDKLIDLHFPFAAVPDIYVNSGFKLHFKPDQEQEKEQETGSLFVAMRGQGAYHLPLSILHRFQTHK
jgi:hypothetical protein